jgi:hypothetical protein
VDKPLDKLVPPTDNLHKFQTVSGLLLMVAVSAAFCALGHQESMRSAQAMEKFLQEHRESKQQSDALVEGFMADHEKLFAKYRRGLDTSDSEWSELTGKRSALSVEQVKLETEARRLDAEIRGTSPEPGKGDATGSHFTRELARVDLRLKMYQQRCAEYESQAELKRWRDGQVLEGAGQRLDARFKQQQAALVVEDKLRADLFERQERNATQERIINSTGLMVLGVFGCVLFCFGLRGWWSAHRDTLGIAAPAGGSTGAG